MGSPKQKRSRSQDPCSTTSSHGSSASFPRNDTEETDPPKTRGDCVGKPRPCPFVRCRYHLYADVTKSGALKVNFDEEVWELEQTCALDVADVGNHTLDQVGKWLGVTRERIRQIECTALCKLEKLMSDYRDFIIRDPTTWDDG